MRRQTVGIAAVASLVLVALVGTVVALTRNGAITPTAALGPPHYMDETATSGLPAHVRR